MATLWPGVSLTARTAALTAAQADRVKQFCGLAPKPGVFAYYEGPAGQTAVFDAVIGKHLPIDFVLAADAQGKIRGFEILAYREAYGGQVKQRRWRRQFIGRSLKDPLQPGQDIDAISGATLSARHLSRAVRRVLATLQVIRETTP